LPRRGWHGSRMFRNRPPQRPHPSPPARWRPPVSPTGYAAIHWLAANGADWPLPCDCKQSVHALIRSQVSAGLPPSTWISLCDTHARTRAGTGVACNVRTTSTSRRQRRRPVDGGSIGVVPTWPSADASRPSLPRTPFNRPLGSSPPRWAMACSCAAVCS